MTRCLLNRAARRIQYGSSKAPDIRGLFSVFDGHAGEEVAHFCMENMHRIIEEQYLGERRTGSADRFDTW